MIGGHITCCGYPMRRMGWSLFVCVVCKRRVVAE